MPNPISSTTGASRPNRATMSSGSGAKSMPMTGQSSSILRPFGQAAFATDEAADLAHELAVFVKTSWVTDIVNCSLLHRSGTEPT